MWGRMCIWLQGTPIGDLNNPHCGIGGPCEELRKLSEIALQLWEPEFKSLSDSEIYDLLDDKTYGCRRGIEIAHGRSDIEVRRDSEKYSKYTFLTNSGEQFDENGKCFLFRRLT
jgi:hypothetical protein